MVAASIIPGDQQAVHHVLLGSADQAPGDQDRESVFQNYIMGYAPGNESSYMPEGTGVFVPAGGVYLTQMHYTLSALVLKSMLMLRIIIASQLIHCEQQMENWPLQTHLHWLLHP